MLKMAGIHYNMVKKKSKPSGFYNFFFIFVVLICSTLAFLAGKRRTLSVSVDDNFLSANHMMLLQTEIEKERAGSRRLQVELDQARSDSKMLKDKLDNIETKTDNRAGLHLGANLGQLRNTIEVPKDVTNVDNDAKKKMDISALENTKMDIVGTVNASFFSDFSFSSWAYIDPNADALVLAPNQNRAFSLRHSVPKKIGNKLTYQEVQKCNEIDVVTIKTEVCTAVLQNTIDDGMMFNVMRYKKDPDNNNKYTQIRRTDNAYPIPKISVSGVHKNMKLLSALWARHNEIRLKTIELLMDLPKEYTSSDSNFGPAIVMCMNRNNIQLFLNWLCSARELGFDVKKRLIVFAADEETAGIITKMGIKAFYDIGFGEFPTEGHQAYGDANFVKMMWLKVISAYFVAASGHDFLFQDTDIVWQRDPIEYFINSKKEKGKDVADIYFQKDGNYQARYTPYSANSGFYFVRNNEQTFGLLADMLFSYNLIQQVQSHQHALHDILLKHSHLTAIKIEVLDEVRFPNGKFYWHRLPELKAFVSAKNNDGLPAAYMFHACWTKNNVDKLKMFNDLDLWHIKKDGSCNGQSYPQCCRVV